LATPAWTPPPDPKRHLAQAAKAAETERPVLKTQWEAHAVQSDILTSPARFIVAAMGRRAGKTEVGIVWLFRVGLELIEQGYDPESIELWWVAPTFELTQRGYNKIIKKTKEDGSPNPLYALFQRGVRSPYPIIYCKNGLRIQFKSAERQEQLEGEGVHAVVFDEFSWAGETAWTESLYPALGAAGGRALLISKPRGRNLFYRLFQKGRDREANPEWTSYHAPSWCNPYLYPGFIEEARRDLPDRVFRQEIAAEFLDDAGAVFRNTRTLITTEAKYRGPATSRGWGLQRAAAPGVRYVAGWDPAKHADYSVLTVLRLPERHVVHWERRQTVDYPTQCEWVANVCQGYNHAPLLMDSSGAGDPVFDFISRIIGAGGVEGYKFTNVTKADLVNQLALAIDKGTVSYPDIPVLLNELEIFEMTKSEAGNVKYAAPEGYHDDCVMSLALANLKSMTGAAWAPLPADHALSRIFTAEPTSTAPARATLIPQGAVPYGACATCKQPLVKIGFKVQHADGRPKCPAA
jgi:hypothetical protein